MPSPLLRVVLATALAASALAQAPNPPAPEPEKKDLVINLGGVLVNRTRLFVEVAGQVSIDRGLIELFACTKDGKCYESAVVLGCTAERLQAGLLGLGLTHGESGRFAGDQIKTPGSPVQILISWTDPTTQQVVRHLAEDLVWDHRADGAMRRVGWVFIGSRFARNPQTQREVFMASASGSLIVTYHDPDAILDTPHDAGTDDTTFYANHEVLPARGTALTVRIYPSKTYDALPADEQALPRAPAAPEAPKDPPK